MSATDYDSRTADKFVVRLPDKLRAEIEAAANAGDCSMNSVFVQAVRQYLDGQNRQQILLDALANTVTTPMTADSMHIDDRVRMAANAGRYEWLRDRTCIEDADNDIMVVRGDQYFDGDELDREIDNALRLARLEELHPCAD
ncbi:Arc family DNA-binding protein [Pseudomonas veronii]|uniref:Arc family DNA-binding protein n=1 Tax=Pseudomonas veronii TaxID=76761 RepID=UPI002110445B|nr:Arc family DNA-binding protein [Pseudomonas veronii]